MNSQSPGFLALLILQKFSFYVPHFLLKGREPFSYIPIRIIGWHVQLLIYWQSLSFSKRQLWHKLEQIIGKEEQEAVASFERKEPCVSLMPLALRGPYLTVSFSSMFTWLSFHPIPEDTVVNIKYSTTPLNFQNRCSDLQKHVWETDWEIDVSSSYPSRTNTD